MQRRKRPFFAKPTTDKLLPEAAEAAVLACPPSVEDELWREGDRWIVEFSVLN